jgi:hypothetical protein
MFRIAARSVTSRRATLHIQHRNFVSTVLLSRTWENESAVDLRREAKQRGLSSKGNKATLILRIQEHDQRETLEAISDKVPSVTRNSSSVATGVTPGIPPDSQINRPPPAEFTNVYLPDISQPAPGRPVQIPFVPDFWESSSAKEPKLTEPTLPKLLVVAGDTHPGGGPSHNLHDAAESTHTELSLESTSKPPIPKAPNGFWRDIAEDIGIPASINLPRTTEKTRQEGGSTSEKLTPEESRGVWLLLGMLSGSWIIAGMVNKKAEDQLKKD